MSSRRDAALEEVVGSTFHELGIVGRDLDMLNSFISHYPDMSFAATAPRTIRKYACEEFAKLLRMLKQHHFDDWVGPCKASIVEQIDVVSQLQLRGPWIDNLRTCLESRWPTPNDFVEAVNVIHEAASQVESMQTLCTNFTKQLDLAVEDLEAAEAKHKAAIEAYDRLKDYCQNFLALMNYRT